VTELYPDPVRGYVAPDLGAALARLSEEGRGVTVVYAPSTSTTTIHAAPVPAPYAFPAGIAPTPQPPTAAGVASPARRTYSLGEVVAYCSTSVLAASSVAGIAWLICRSPLPAGLLAALAALGVLAGTGMVHREQDRGQA
jgi:hypothetical protein